MIRRTAIILSSFCALASAAKAAPVAVSGRPLTMDDILALSFIDRATLSPDGRSVAVVIRRSATAGEVYGRTAYEIDPTRSDVWLISSQSASSRNLTRGRGRSAGSWCATWSPDGRRLAMLSTRPEGREPQGGDNVRIYAWDKMTDRVARVSSAAVMTETRYGSPINALNLAGGAQEGSGKLHCSEQGEGSPILWLDDHRLLAVTLPTGAISQTIDQYVRASRNAANSARDIRMGTTSTGIAVGSGAERVAPAGADDSAVLRVIDLAAHTERVIATVPAFPFRGGLAIRVAPDGRSAAVLATVASLAPVSGQVDPKPDREDWMVEKRLGIVALDGPPSVRWAALPSDARLPFALDRWSADSRTISFKARAGRTNVAETLFRFDIATGAAVSAIETKPTVNKPVGPPVPPGTQQLDALPARRVVLSSVATSSGVTLRLSAPAGNRDLLTLNRHLAKVSWGQTRLIDYQALDGQSLKGALIMPPGARIGTRLPLLMWIYPGYRVEQLDGDYWLDPYLPGVYNLQLYAASGYAVFVPSMPLPHTPERRNVLATLTNGVLPAVDRLVSLGIADPNRVGVMGQSYGGYGVLGLLTQTRRFRAGVALAGISDLSRFPDEFDPLGRTIPGIGHQMSANSSIAAQFGLSPAHRANAGENSPLQNAECIDTPLLILHGELDNRGGIDEAEAMFNALYRQGKTARFVRYAGESHSLAQSPANVRDVFRETLRWLERYLSAGVERQGKGHSEKGPYRDCLSDSLR